MNPHFKPWLVLGLFVLATFIVAGVGNIFTNLSVHDWYKTLNKPSWNPPNWVFGPVWTALYILMAIAAWLVWRRYGFAGAAFPLTLFFMQLLLNAAWSGFFFGLRNPKLAFFEILLLWGAILATVISFWQNRAIAAVLMLPYLLWVTYAGILNLVIWRINL